MSKYEQTRQGYVKYIKRICKYCMSTFYTYRRGVYFCQATCRYSYHYHNRETKIAIKEVHLDEKTCIQCGDVRNMDFFDGDFCLKCKKENKNKQEQEKRLEKMREDFRKELE